nr:VTC domain-containing protein [candidate division KSB1 bacterium]NIR71919.1 VTC domain-containing protein [candidate division KSB1 bacterium]NIS23629.1 VTC domain-containing protein [candidate division KSB1 bacterium]NIT70553.1 VTC domain-containing protein [candidate division KSB1 bacterium]NIU24470.1 VTC domain-containing protein [candidate division KSB1 bacterium]
AYHDKMAGAAIRHKLRVRAYGENPREAPFVRLEVKSRYISFIHKITVDIPIDEYDEVEPALLGRGIPPERILMDNNVSKEFFRLQRQLNMEPTIMVQYRREAYEKTEMNRVRVNFDDHLKASRNLDLLGPFKGGRSLLKYGHSIFEIKVDGTMPFWLHTLISKYNLQNEAISKFCHGIRSQARFSSVAREEYV